MKNLRFLIISLAFATFAFSYSCNNGGTNQSNQTNKDSVKTKSTNKDTAKTAELNEKTAKYMCPMKCEGSFSNTKGKCPKCGMDKIENPNYGK